MFTGIWFLFLMPYREFEGHKIYSGIVWEPAFFYYAFAMQTKLHSICSFEMVYSPRSTYGC